MTKLSNICSKIIEWGWLVAIIILPMVFSTSTGNNFAMPKTIVFRSIVTIMLLAWLIRYFENKETEVKNTQLPNKDNKQSFYQRLIKQPLYSLMVIFFIIYTLATIFSINFTQSFWGLYQRVDGFYTFIFYIIFFFLVASNLKTVKQQNRIINAIILASVPVCLYGISQHFGQDFVGWKGSDVFARVVASMGNTIHFGGYLAMIIPFTLYKIIKREKNIYYNLIVALALIMQIAVLIYTLSRGAWLGFAASTFVLAILWGIKTKKMVIWIPLIAATAIVIAIVASSFVSDKAYQALKQNTYTERFVSIFHLQDTISQRFTVWHASIQAIARRPLLGYGPDTYPYAFNANYYPPVTGFGEIWFDRSHNQYLDYAVHAGIPALIVFLLILFYSLWFNLKNFWKNNNLLSLAVLGGILTYAIHIFSAFNYPASIVYFYLFFALTVSLKKQKENPRIEEKNNQPNLFFREKNSLRYLILFLLCAGLIFKTDIMPFWVDTIFQKGNIAIARGGASYQAGIALHAKAADLLPYQSTYRAKLAEDYVNGAIFLSNNRGGSLTEEYFQTGMAELEKANLANPLDQRVLIDEEQTYKFWATRLNQPAKLDQAIVAIKKLQKLIPNHQLTYWDWADILTLQGKTQEALEKYQYAYDLDPQLDQARQKLADFKTKYNLLR